MPRLTEYAQIVEEHQQTVFRMLCRLTGEPPHAVEDMAQEVFLRIFRGLREFRGEAKLTTYLYRIICNVVHDEFSRRQRSRQNVPIDAEEAPQIRDDRPGPAQENEQAQLSRALQSAMERLEDGDRELLALFYQEQRSYEQIAAITSTTIGTVKSRLHRARLKLRTKMKEWTTCRAR